MGYIFAEFFRQGCLRAGLYAGWELLFVRRQPLLIENILLKLCTKVDSYSSAGTKAGIFFLVKCSISFIGDVSAYSYL
jgi:hypothetical protein